MKKTITLILIFTLLLSCFATPVFATEAETVSPPEITAQNALMINLNTGAVVYEKSPEEQLFPASLTKLATMLVAADLISDYSEVITISKKECYSDLVAIS